MYLLSFYFPTICTKMKTFILFIIVINTVIAFTISDLQKYNSVNELLDEIARRDSSETIAEVNVSDIKIFFHSRKTDNNGIEIDLPHLETLSKTDFNNTKDSIFIVHGWLSDHRSEINTLIKDAYLAVQDVNIFVVDWSKWSKRFYTYAQASVESVGHIVGDFIKELVEQADLKFEKTVLVGQSLGAHIAGVMGARIGGQAHHVVGLDPAGPSFSLDNKDNRIDISDGKFVQVIHTNAGFLGWNVSLGHSDYWPNGGSWQPSCDSLDTGCDHERVLRYFAESVRTGNFIAKSCQDWPTYQNGGCNNGKSSYLGQANIDTSASGNYYLETNSEPPYAKG